MKKFEIIVLATGDEGLTCVMDRCHLTAQDTADAARQYAALFPGHGAGRADETLRAFTRSQAGEAAGRPVTNKEAKRIAHAVPFSTAPEACADIVFAVCGTEGDDDAETAAGPGETGSTSAERSSTS